jgi:hypothetical protein
VAAKTSVTKKIYRIGKTFQLLHEYFLVADNLGVRIALHVDEFRQFDFSVAAHAGRPTDVGSADPRQQIS